MKYSSLRLCFPLVLAGDFLPLSKRHLRCLGVENESKRKSKKPLKVQVSTFNFPNRFSDNQKGKSEGFLPCPGFIPCPWNWKANVAFLPMVHSADGSQHLPQDFLRPSQNDPHDTFSQYQGLRYS